MPPAIDNSVNDGLDHQGLKRSLSEAEARMAAVMEQIFRDGVTDFEEVASRLQQSGVKPPSGAATAWSADLLLSELTMINQSLDKAYESGGMP